MRKFITDILAKANLGVEQNAYVLGTVGIGTSTPSTKLHVEGGTLLVKSNVNNGSAILTIRSSDDYGYTFSRSNTTGFLVFDGNQTGAIGYVFNNGNVGIGTNSPTANLHVNGTGRFGGTLSFDQPVGLLFANGQYIKDNNSGGLIINSGAAVNINGTSLTFAGAATFSNNLVTTNGITDPAYARITTPGGGISINNDPQSAAIKIALPANGSFTNTMISFTVHIYDYALGKTRTLKIAGYTYFSQVWYNMSVYQSGGELIGNINVRFGVEGGRNCVWIGETNTYWSYPNIFITDVQCGHSQTANLTSGWTISFVTTLGTVQDTIIAYTNVTTKSIVGTTNYVSKFTGANTLGNSLIFDNGTNIGIGTTSPSSKFEVAGKSLSRTTDSGWGQSAVANPNDTEVGFVWAAGGTGYPGVDSTYTRQWIAGLSPFGTGTDRWSLTNKTLGANTAITVLEGGNVGIGTTSPGAKLEIAASNSTLAISYGNTVPNNPLHTNYYGGYTGIGMDSATAGVRIVGDTNILVMDAGYYTSNVIQHASWNSLLKVMTNGNVGINVSSPSLKLEVGGGSRFHDTMYFGGSTQGGVTWGSGRFIISSYSGLDMTLGTDGFTDRLTVKASTGNVGIGTTSPGYKLHVIGAVGIGQNTNGTATIDAYGGNAYYGCDGTQITVNGNSNNVGIGTTTPGQRLSVSGNIESINPYGKIGFTVADSYGDYPHYGLGKSSGANPVNLAGYYGLTFGTLGYQRLVINTDGSVGIGTSSPATKLTLGEYSGSRLPYINGTVNTFNASGITVTSSNTANSAIGGGLDLTNNVHSIGSFSPLISFSALTQSGTYNNNYAAIYGILAGDSGDGNWNTGHIVFATTTAYGANEKVRITSAGNVGIGTSSPGYKTEVSGSIGNYWTGSAFTGTPLALSITNSQPGGYDSVLILQQADGGGTVKNSGAIGMVGTGPWTSGNNASQVSDMYFLVRNGSGVISERMRITSGGNVLIGTTSDNGSKLQVTGNARFNYSDGYGYFGLGYISGADYGIYNYNYGRTDLIIQQSTGAATFTSSVTAARLILTNGDNLTWGGGYGAGIPTIVGYNAGSGGSLYFYPNGSTSGSTLTIAPTGAATFSSSVTASVLRSINSGVDATFQDAFVGVYSGNNNEQNAIQTSVSSVANWSGFKFQASNGGGSAGRTTVVDFLRDRALFYTSVGIGTTGPEAKLHIVSGSGQAGFLSRGINGDTWFPYSNGQNYVRGVTNFDSGSAYFTGGNVGIGTSSPGQKLTVAGSGNTYIQVNNGSANAYFGRISDAGTIQSDDDITFRPSSTEVMRLTNGKVGIGTTSPSEKLFVNSGGAYMDTTVSYGTNTKGIVLNQEDGTGYGTGVWFRQSGLTAGIGSTRVNSSDWATDLRFYTHPSSTTNQNTLYERMRINSEGNVGIGTSSPTALLTVNGSIQVGLGSGGSGTPTQSVFQDTYGGLRSAIAVKNTADYAIGRGSGYSIQNGNGVEKAYIQIAANDATQTGYSLNIGTNGGGGLTIASTGAATFSSSVSAQQFTAADGYGLNVGNFQVGGISGNRFYIYNNTLGVDNISIIPSTGITTFARGVNITSGNVGIGTSSPQSKLQIGESYLSTAGTIKLITVNTGGYYSTTNASQYNVMGFSPTTIDTSDIYTQNTGELVKNFYLGVVSEYAYFNGNRFSIFQGGAERLTIQGYGASVGNVGIGTTSPSQKLHLYGSGNQLVFIENSSTYHLYTGISSNVGIVGSTNATPLSLQTNGVSRVYLDTSGNVGIGTTSPAYPLVAQSSSTNENTIMAINSTNNISRIGFIQNGSANLAYTTIEGDGRVTGYMAFKTADTERIRITSAGNVGIGTYNTDNYAASGRRILSLNGSSNTMLEFKVADSSYAYIYRDSRLEVYDADRIDLSTNAAIRATINSSGNVGIGTTSPKAKLDINGAIGFGSKSINISDTFVNALTVNINAHNGCYVKITAFGDWGNHSTIAYLGEFFLQNSAGAYNEPGTIIRQVDNTAGDDIQAQIVQPAGSGTRDFVIQLKTTSASFTPFTIYLQYEVRGQYNSIS